MSDVGAMDCRDAAGHLYEFLDGELSAADAAKVRAHLAVCAHCFGLFDFETAYLRFLEARTRARGAPVHLRQRILDQLLFDPGRPGTA
jgi:anti-sigma factor (TIGR02949 family)